ncbi:MAG: hypothetical protein O7F15_08370, partial [Gammaproteobacteria bacterium]|nr:hypothetical protein [Gammaproteobacteria bacterium]
MNLLIFLFGFLAIMFTIARYSVSFRNAALVSFVFLLVFSLAGGFSFFLGLVVWGLFLLPTLLFAVPELRQNLLSNPLLNRIRAVLPPMSET